MKVEDQVNTNKAMYSATGSLTKFLNLLPSGSGGRQ